MDKYIHLLSFLNDNAQPSQVLVQRVINNSSLCEGLRIKGDCKDLSKVYVHQDDLSKLLSLIDKELCRFTL